ncbi:MAG: hypothetical protein JW812_00535 [Alphaproteobacteria bacterium]|nr:hypothetical protein [Alphaproteobacteria bacterium]MBN2779673.1 hypothetical protein [Alphaproteobacteria bacterium]
MTNENIIMTAAVIVGPILAVIITRWLDNRRSKKDMRLQIFRALMRDRRNKLSFDFVAALNLIEVEFYDDKSVISAWKRLYESLIKRWHNDEEKYQITYEWDILTTKLLSEVGKCLGFKNIEQTDIMSGGYAPQGWAERENKQYHINELLINLLENNNSLKVDIISNNTSTIKSTKQKNN